MAAARLICAGSSCFTMLYVFLPQDSVRKWSFEVTVYGTTYSCSLVGKMATGSSGMDLLGFAESTAAVGWEIKKEKKRNMPLHSGEKNKNAITGKPLNQMRNFLGNSKFVTIMSKLAFTFYNLPFCHRSVLKIFKAT